jgi:hypothetical protein
VSSKAGDKIKVDYFGMVLYGGAPWALNRRIIMITLNELCNRTAGSQTTSDSLRHACALPRSPVDMAPLPEPHRESSFDSAWEALLSGTNVAAQEGE